MRLCIGPSKHANNEREITDHRYRMANDVPWCASGNGGSLMSDMIQSDEIAEIASALAKAQGVIKNPEKLRTNPHFRSKYADLATGLDCIRPPLSANGIAIIQAPGINADGVYLTTRLIHSSGQYLGCIYPVASSSADHQKLGAALTYAKRQALFSLVGICGDDDLDGEDIKTSGDGKIKDANITSEQVSALRTRIEEVGADEQAFLRYLKTGSLAVLSAADFARAMSELDRKAAKGAAQ